MYWYDPVSTRGLLSMKQTIKIFLLSVVTFVNFNQAEAVDCSEAATKRISRKVSVAEKVCNSARTSLERTETARDLAIASIDYRIRNIQNRQGPNSVSCRITEFGRFFNGRGCNARRNNNTLDLQKQRTQTRFEILISRARTKIDSKCNALSALQVSYSEFVAQCAAGSV
jgi:hypothetical protein